MGNASYSPTAVNSTTWHAIAALSTVPQVVGGKPSMLGLHLFTLSFQTYVLEMIRSTLHHHQIPYAFKLARDQAWSFIILEQASQWLWYDTIKVNDMGHMLAAATLVSRRGSRRRRRGCRERKRG